MIKFLDIGFMPLKKCGYDPISAAIGGAVTGGIGLIGSGISAITQSDINDSQLDFSARQAQINRDWQTEEAQKQRDWQSAEWDKQFAAQNEEWYKQADTQYGYQLALQRQQQEYNSPASQVARLERAGLNPALALGQGASGNSVGFASAPSGSVTPTSVPSGAMPSPVGQIQPNLQNPMSGFGSTIKNFADAFRTLYLTGSEGKKVLAEADKYLSESGLNKLYAASQQIKNSILRSTKDAHIRQVFADLDNTYKDIWLKGISGDLKQTEIDYVIADTMVKKAQEALTYAKTDQQKQETMAYFTILKNMFELWKKQGNAAVTSANAQAQAVQVDARYKDSLIALNNDQHALNVFDRMVKMIDENGKPLGWTAKQALEKQKELYLGSLDEALSRQNITEEQLKQAKELTKQMRVASDYAELNNLLGALGSVVGMGTAIAASKGALKSAGARETQANNWGRFIDGQLERLNKPLPGTESSFDRFNNDDWQMYNYFNYGY